MLDYGKLTELVLEFLIKNINNPSVASKIKGHLKIGNLVEDTVNIIIDDEFVRSLLTNQYNGVLEEAISEKLQSDYKIKIYESADDLPTIRSVPSTNIEDTRSFKIDELVASDIDRTLTFDNYFVSASNELACTMAKGAIKSLGKQWNPLFIYGGSGFGKTHLVNAFGNEVINSSNNTKTVKYYDGNTFKSELFDVFYKGPNETNKFKEKLWKYDVLIFDDIQFIGQGKESTIDVFFEIFNEFIKMNKHIVLTSDVSPQEMKKMKLFHDRLITRFSQGVTAKIDAPDQDLKERIVATFWDNVVLKIDDTSILSKEAVTFIASNFEDIRSIQGAINSIYVSLINRKDDSAEITKDFVKKAIPNMLSGGGKSKKVSLALVAKVVCSEYSIEIKSMKGKSRIGSVQKARNTFSYVARKLLETSYAEIGKYLNRTHSTVMSSEKTAKSELKTNQEYKALIDRIISAIIS